MGAAGTGLGRLARALQVVGQVVLAFMALTICYDALMRYAFAAPTSWSLEVNGFLIVYLAVMTAADVQRTDEHIRITFFTAKLGALGRRLGAVAIGAVGAAFAGIMAWRGGMIAYQAWEYGERVSSSFGTPMVLPYAMLPVGFGVLALVFVLNAVEAWRRPDGPEATGADRESLQNV